MCIYLQPVLKENLDQLSRERETGKTLDSEREVIWVFRDNLGTVLIDNRQFVNEEYGLKVIDTSSHA